jgi:hypothetical protein
MRTNRSLDTQLQLLSPSGLPLTPNAEAEFPPSPRCRVYSAALWPCVDTTKATDSHANKNDPAKSAFDAAMSAHAGR